jgi:hypothetical protein
MKRKPILWLPILIFASIACFCNIDVRKLSLGCYWQQCAPERDFHVRDWEIPVAFFSSDAKVSGMMIPSEGAGEIERGSQNIVWNNGDGSAIYHIHRYPTESKAINEYDRVHRGMVDDGTKIPWSYPEVFNFTSSSADEIFIGCGTWTEKRCGMLARYQEYVIYFHASIDEKMSYSDFEEIMIYLDEQITVRLYP